ncbi:carboxy-terminal processing protease [Bacteroides pyogenes DSM 20611 = JCM 6294]|uniref:Carboxy-terminal processing protease n=1 Tax=Bacteroides pyogenes DSM 20611 = JCM 6294 TaxID=1121100 RepID=W4PF30_9BACE|nr:carboxy-terminal processing protease [Bacteroides pyogenes DSM 20611 = JCM 6294]
MSTKNSSRFTPVIIAVSVVIGILIGTFYAKHFAGNRLGIINASSNKLNALLRIIDDQYVDTVNMGELVEKAMPQILAELDPHSTYIPAKNLEEINSELEGSFSGIGIQFTIQNDTIHVNAVIQGGPSEKVGLMAGDRIISVNDSAFVGKKINNELAMRTLKGPKGSQVKIGVKRSGEKQPLSFTITRGDIPQNTVDAAYMLTNEIGYIKVSKFGRTSHMELLKALAELNQKKCKADNRPARQYGRLHGSRHPYGKRILARRQTNRIYARTQISPFGRVCKRNRKLPENPIDRIGR